MSTYSLSQLSDQTLLQHLNALLARDRATTAELLAHLAEVDARKLYLPAGHPSMYAYCIEVFGMSEDTACKRIRAARAARACPGIFDAFADGRLNLSAVVLLAPHLTQESAERLLRLASHKKNSEIERLLACQFPRPDLPERLSLVSPGSTAALPVQSEPEPPSAPKAPLSPQRFGLQVTLSQNAHDLLRTAQALLGHQVPSGNLSQVLERVLAIAVRQLEKQKSAATDQPRSVTPASHSRSIQAHVKRAVWKRDGGRCSFVSESGRRCLERGRLEYDHVDPVARGGQAIVSRVRLLCRAHNQYAAECAFGPEFMKRKRETRATTTAPSILDSGP